MRALLLLYRLQFKSRIRRLWAGMKTVKGMIVTVIILFFLGIMVLPNIMLMIGMDKRPELNTKIYVPFALFGYFIFSMMTSIGDRSIYFTPSEVDQLFPAPFSRRELLAYKVLGWAFVSLSMAFFFSIAFAIYIPNLIFGFAGIAVTLLTMTLADMLMTLLGQTVTQRLYSTGRQIVALICLAMLAAGLSQSLLRVELTDLNNVTAWFTTVSDSTFGKVILAPFQVFANAVFAEGFIDFAKWIAISLVMLTTLVLCIFRLDANYLETAVGVSQKVFEQVQRMQQGQSKVSEKSTRWKLRMLPFWGGFGPMAWRQIVTVIRQSKTVIFVTLFIAVAISVPIILDFDNKLVSTPAVVGLAFGIMAYITTIFSLSMAIGFRGDIDHIEVFKALPLRPFTIAAGELIGAVLLFTLMHLFLATVGLLALRKYPVWWFTGMIFIVPFNVLILSASNSLFLWFPVRNLKGGKDMETIGQGFLFMFFLGLIFLCVGVICMGPAIAVYFFTHHVFASWAVAWVLLTICAIVGVYVTGYSYVRFDVTKVPA